MKLSGPQTVRDGIWLERSKIPVPGKSDEIVLDNQSEKKVNIYVLFSMFSNYSSYTHTIF